jgi:hypothetical protein
MSPVSSLNVERVQLQVMMNSCCVEFDPAAAMP